MTFPKFHFLHLGNSNNTDFMEEVFSGLNMVMFVQSLADSLMTDVTVLVISSANFNLLGVGDGN